MFNNKKQLLCLEIKNKLIKSTLGKNGEL
jgi:hypothetical protein